MGLRATWGHEFVCVEFTLQLVFGSGIHMVSYILNLIKADGEADFFLSVCGLRCRFHITMGAGVFDWEK
jgi:hypothetical protein